MRASREEILRQHLKVDVFNLRTKLERLLPDVKKRGLNIFCNSSFELEGFSSNEYHQDADKLLRLAQRIVKARDELGEPAENCLGEAYLAACKENCSRDEHRRGPRKLGVWLSEIVASNT
ncbi:MAG: hypothetical protein N0C84_20465 [Candidatus Thiodiazotropha taylori]|uniref:Uncharacterized protein n=1 Tax=Candidatus Thiodiazotropha taylori TaxID=2792791 RepID=A0A9E4N714_9GAMM|nr:hypothetical protein [Candidatus Thiodiazotropha taylori]MCW4258843.1 hypothetical protein [Candidatus Thiodiazotropha taylori]